jgi:hypothetical protein
MAVPTPPITVKFVAKGHAFVDRAIFVRQFPGNQPRWGRCQFVFDPEADQYDWLVVYDDLPPLEGERHSSRSENLRCPPQHSLFITMEPSSIKTYGYDFLDQFGVILTSQEPWAIRNPQAEYTQPALRWFYGADPIALRTYDEMVASPPTHKTAKLSTVCSTKKQSNTLHAQRYEFTKTLKGLLPELAWFGSGVQPLADKADALDRYCYHIAIENHICPHHWTEKLSDCFLGHALPFYCGCPNAADYFPAESFIQLDIRDPVAAAHTIQQAIAAGEYERRLPAIREARRRVLEEYNLFAVVSQAIEKRHDPTARAVPGTIVLSRQAMRRRSWQHVLRYGWEHWQIRRKNRRLQQRSKAA